MTCRGRAHSMEGPRHGGQAVFRRIERLVNRHLAVNGFALGGVVSSRWRAT